MGLATFIVQNVDAILEEWVEFARTLRSSEGLDLEGLRDHAKRMLLTVAADMRAPQTDEAQQVKSRGEAPRASIEETAAETHGDQRYLQGFKLDELIAEYRALRATVIRLWLESETVDARTLYELTRFNEGIDQLIAESVVSFSTQLDHARQVFMGVLGHDLRTDLQVILASAQRLERVPHEVNQKYVPYITESIRHVNSIVEDLLDVTRTRFGTQLPLERKLVDVAATCESVLQPFRHLHPNCHFQLKVEGDITGQWDPQRLEQLLANLVRNATQHGNVDLPITLSAAGAAEEVVFKVHNHGGAIPQALLTRIFEPMQQAGPLRDKSSLGLGLYIAKAIALAHGGTLTATSSETGGTTFTARLPKRGGVQLSEPTT